MPSTRSPAVSLTWVLRSSDAFHPRKGSIYVGLMRIDLGLGGFVR